VRSWRVASSRTRVILQAADRDLRDHGAARLLVAVEALAAVSRGGRERRTHALPHHRHDDLARHGGYRVRDAAARAVHGAERHATGFGLRRAKQGVVPLALVFIREGSKRAAVLRTGAERRSRHVRGGILAI